MSAQEFVGLLEKLIDLKVQQQVELQAKVAPEMNHFLQQKRESDRQKMVQIKRELIAVLESSEPPSPPGFGAARHGFNPRGTRP